MGHLLCIDSWKTITKRKICKKLSFFRESKLNVEHGVALHKLLSLFPQINQPWLFWILLSTSLAVSTMLLYPLLHTCKNDLVDFSIVISLPTLYLLYWYWNPLWQIENSHVFINTKLHIENIVWELHFDKWQHSGSHIESRWLQCL